MDHDCAFPCVRVESINVANGALNKIDWVLLTSKKNLTTGSEYSLQPISAQRNQFA